MICARDNYDHVVFAPCSILLHDNFNCLLEYPFTIDLLNVFGLAYYCDISTPLNKSGGRQITLIAPVKKENIDQWKRNRDLVVQLLHFVTEGDQDSWTLDFVPTEYYQSGQIRLINDAITGIDNVSLLSGGLDSFCGIYQNEKLSETSYYCAYKTSTIDTGKINLAQHFAHNINTSCRIAAFDKITPLKITKTQRTRSLLFFALACCVAVYANTKIIRIFENGIMSLNPSFETRATTRTTHPKTIFLFQNLLNQLDIKITLTHPFLFLTKGEMIESLPEKYKLFINQTRSCSHSKQVVKYSRSGINSCGACIPCLLRKISISAYNNEKYDHDYFIPYNSQFDDVDYLSSYHYFLRFAKAIDNDTIFTELGMRKIFYSDEYYYERTQSMLETFRSELEVFFNKYGR